MTRRDVSLLLLAFACLVAGAAVQPCVERWHGNVMGEDAKGLRP